MALSSLDGHTFGWVYISPCAGVLKHQAKRKDESPELLRTLQQQMKMDHKLMLATLTLLLSVSHSKPLKVTMPHSFSASHFKCIFTGLLNISIMAPCFSFLSYIVAGGPQWKRQVQRVCFYMCMSQTRKKKYLLNFTLQWVHLCNSGCTTHWTRLINL